MLCVIAALLLPVLQMKYQLVRTGLVTENRKKAPMPNNAWTILSTHSTYASDFEKYFNDNFGFRDLLIRLKNQFEYSLFAFSSQVHIGPNKWLFYKGTYEDTVLALERLRPDMNKLFSRMRRLRDLLAAKGITLVVVPCPMKTTMYQEELPPIDIHVPEFSSFDEYRQFLREEPGIITIDAEKILRDLKEKMQVYHRTDFHWNDPAGAHTLVELLATMERKAGVPISQKPSIAVRIDPHTGGGRSIPLPWCGHHTKTCSCWNPLFIKLRGFSSTEEEPTRGPTPRPSHAMQTFYHPPYYSEIRLQTRFYGPALRADSANYVSSITSSSRRISA